MEVGGGYFFFFFLVSLVGEVIFFKNYNFTTGFRGRVGYFFFSTAFGREVYLFVRSFVRLFVCFSFPFLLLRLVNFFLVSTAGDFFFQKTSMPPSGYQMVRPLLRENDSRE